MSTALTELRLDDPVGVRERLCRQSIETTDGCLLWTGAQRGTGYGAIKIAGHARAVHQVAFILAKGPIPRGQLVRHTCGRSLCINADHLTLGDDAINARDAVAHGTAPGLHHRRLPIRTRQAIFALAHAAEPFSGHEIHRLLGLPLSTVKTVLRRGS